MNLTSEAVRVLGALVEKERTTPENYPLSLNALTSACNQKSNRDPVMALSESEVMRALESLRGGGLAMRSADGGRVSRYAHNLIGKLQVSIAETALLAELLLRGPQTPGELRTRAERMHHFADLGEIEAALQHLAEHEPQLVVKLPRQPGRKESRYMQLFAGPPSEEQEGGGGEKKGAQGEVRSEGRLEGRLEGRSDASSEDRLGRLEEEVRVLREEVKRLGKELRSITMQPEEE